MSEYKSLVNKMVQVAVEPCDDMFMLIPILWDYSKVIPLFLVCDVENNPFKRIGKYSKEISKNWYKYFEKGC